MYVIEFPSLRLVESKDPISFAAVAEAWMTQREAENHVILSVLSGLVAGYRGTGACTSRFFTLQDGNVVAAALIAGPRMVHITWAALEMVDPIVSGLQNCGYSISQIHGPGHVAFFLGRAWAERTRATARVGNSQRVYQLARVRHELPEGGRLVAAGEGELAVAKDWMRELVGETGYPCEDPAELARRHVTDGQLHLWHQPGPVAMGAYVEPTPNGISIEHVYVPRSLRRKGHGKAVIAAMAGRMLAAGKRFCFLRADPDDWTADRLFQAVGARTICEYAQCSIVPAGG